MTIQKNTLMIIVVALAVFSHGCVGLFDNGIIDEYSEHVEIYNNDSQKYNDVIYDWIEKETAYDIEYQNVVDISKYSNSYYRSVSTGTSNYEDATRKLSVASNQLKLASDNYKSVANRIYTHLDEFEQFIILNEDVLKRNDINTVQLIADIQKWKEEIRLNLN